MSSWATEKEDRENYPLLFYFSRLLVMGPYAKNLYDFFFGHNLIYQSVVDIDPARISPGEISNEFFV